MKYISILAIPLFLASCNLTTKFETVTIDGHYQMDVPDYMTSSTELNDEASLQYENSIKETYVIVINEEKQMLIDLFTEIGSWDESITPLENYVAIQTESMESSLNILNKKGPNDKKVNGMPVMVYEYDGYAPGISYEIYYYMAYIEGEDELFMVSAWCLGEDKDTYKDTFVKMIESFKEI